jgi:hypothetical protein
VIHRLPCGQLSASDEARFFMSKLREVEQESHHNLSDTRLHFKYYLSEFLAAATSVPQVLHEAVGWPPIDAFRKSWPADEQKLERTLKKSRDLSVHYAESSADSTVQCVPESELPRRDAYPLGGSTFSPRPPGVPETRIGVRRFSIKIDGQDRDAMECCQNYLGLIGRLIVAVGATAIP